MLVSPIVATVTPFRPDGSIDFTALGEYLALLDHAGVTTVLVNGTTGEFASLSARERRQVTEYVRAAWPHTLIVQVGSCAAGEVIEAIQHANDFADYLAVLTPWFFADAPAAGIEAFFTEVLDHARRPVLLYNFPRHTGNVLAPKLVARLASRFPLVCGVKDSGKDRAVTQEYKRLCPRLRVFAGDDRLAPHAAALGIDGVATGAGGPVAELPVRIATAIAAGDSARARQVQAVFDVYTEARKAMPLSDIAFAKAALSARLPGFPTTVRAPLSTATSEQADTIRTILRNNIIGRLHE
ncbi:dihydrodipicolinate synthase family protein [Nocardia blacklockiae]|uniref:dihydrodipicolinate synthase family protein n=1 Tax=Nocardia blacklockiae TaxID=480036 RepID=UPI0018949C56|nr:dihydrodipicolinate synthase family protein [Nocardia blacklockiae]MBF6173613.1 dihydrodipicolinate synthase family protein [Nocardia blacklockiae]